MAKITRQEKLQELHKLLITLDVPQQRLRDLAWLGRNLYVRNRGKTNFSRALELVRDLLRNPD